MADQQSEWYEPTKDGWAPKRMLPGTITRHNGYLDNSGPQKKKMEFDWRVIRREWIDHLDEHGLPYPAWVYRYAKPSTSNETPGTSISEPHETQRPPTTLSMRVEVITVRK